MVWDRFLSNRPDMLSFSPDITPFEGHIFSFQLAKIHKDSPCQWLNLTYCTVQFINSFFVHKSSICETVGSSLSQVVQIPFGPKKHGMETLSNFG